ncbi:hypothetical protein ACFO0N_19510 [Halobium salinum]|uniref:Uncharacterized protein n=1 Tax=Halobium salinum TaxID=1364940 RepID=A0ABD5PH08_9EURY|nr:hypothetical protein [Halobium salinum]
MTDEDTTESTEEPNDPESNRDEGEDGNGAESENGAEHAPDTDEAPDADEVVEDAAEVAEDAADAAVAEAAEAAKGAAEVTEAVPVGRIQELAETAEERLDAFVEAEKQGEADKGLLEELWDVAEEAEALLATVEESAVHEVVDEDAGMEEFGEYVEANKEMAGLPSTVDEAEHEVAVAYRELLDLVELSEVWDAVDIREFLRNKRDLDEELDDVTDYFGGDGWVGDDDGGWVGDDDEGVFETDDDTRVDPQLDPDLGELGGSEGQQAAIQAKVNDAVEEFRGSILDAHERLKEVVEKNRERTRQAGQPDSRNPTAVSTMPPSASRTDLKGGTRHSTVPSETLHSSAPNHGRIYGSRFDRARKRRDEEDDDE